MLLTQADSGLRGRCEDVLVAWPGGVLSHTGQVGAQGDGSPRSGKASAATGKHGDGWIGTKTIKGIQKIGRRLRSADTGAQGEL
jgi:hypothetical protein